MSSSSSSIMDGFECQPCQRQFGQYSHCEDHLIHSSSHHFCRPCQRDFVSEHAKQDHLAHAERHMICNGCRTEVGNPHLHNQKYHEHCPRCSIWCDDEADLHQHHLQDHSDVYLCVMLSAIYSTQQPAPGEETSSTSDLRLINRRISDVPMEPVTRTSSTYVSALLGHFESCTCPSGVDLDMVDDYFGYHCDHRQLFVRNALIFPQRHWNYSDHGGPYPCHMCHKVFNHRPQLDYHLKSPKHKNHGENPYICPSNRCGEAKFIP
ncbi:hypothetical protein KEM48_013662 [Puccinia striiformis f. sp. tritici PST-130]|nr:hypothetical protein KEM48_013662 [Puccinia striiformis f. sp. tritici PST-130]